MRLQNDSHSKYIEGAMTLNKIGMTEEQED